VNKFRRTIATLIIIVVAITVASLGWFGLKYYRSRIDCQRRREVHVQQIEDIRRDAEARLGPGTTKEDVARFFKDHSIRLFTSNNEATGTLETSGCAPWGCGSDAGIIGVRVKIDSAGTVTEAPTVVDLYTNCL
jgi:hypothetical protein